MKIKQIQLKALSSFLAPLFLINIQNLSLAQKTSNEEITDAIILKPDNSELLKKGNTWTYAVSVQIPNEVKFESTLKDQGEKTDSGIIYRFEEIQQSTGLTEVEALNRQAPLINIFIEGKLTKKQVLEYREGSLLYYGTYQHDPENPQLKKGMISIKPVLLYNQRSRVADKWSWTATGLPDFQFRVISKNTEIEVLGKTYTVDKVQMDQVKKGSTTIIQSKEIWFAEDFGIVKEREKSYVGDGKAVIKLLELKNLKNHQVSNNVK